MRSGATSYKTFASKRSQMSRQQRAALGLDKKKDGQGAEAIPEDNAGEESDELEAKPEDFDCCNVCTRPLSEDEKIINARFVNEAIAASRDISVFPVCI